MNKNKKVYSGTLELGNVITIFNRKWRVCNVEGNNYYLAAETVNKGETMYAGVQHPNEYKQTNIYYAAAKYQEELTRRYPDIVERYLVPVTVNGVTSKVFAASKEQMEGEFSYFANWRTRVWRRHDDGKPIKYWTSSVGGSCGFSCYYISSDGCSYCAYITPDEVYFRPFICLRKEDAKTIHEKPLNESMKIMKSIEDYQYLKEHNLLTADIIKQSLGKYIQLFESPWEVVSVLKKDGGYKVCMLGNSRTLTATNLMGDTDTLNIHIMDRVFEIMMNALGVSYKVIWDSQYQSHTFVTRCSVWASEKYTYNQAKGTVDVSPVIEFDFDDAIKYIPIFESVIMNPKYYDFDIDDTTTYKYAIKVTNNFGDVCRNCKIYDENGIKLGVTNRHGNLRFTYPEESMTIKIQRNNGTKHDMRVKLAPVNESTFTKVVMDSYSENVQVGDVINLFDRDWIVCHIEGNKAYLGAKTISCKVEFGDSSIYMHSKLYKAALDYQMELTKKYPDIVKNQLVPVTVNGVTSKVFAASKEQMDGEHGGFSYFDSDKKRLCKYHETDSWYWTSSHCSDGGLWYISEFDGHLYRGYCSGNTAGFRPFICLRLNKNQNPDTSIAHYMDAHIKLRNIALNDAMNKPCYDTLKLGNIITFCDRDWVICHIENGKYYLAAKEIKDLVKFGDTNVYADSQLAKVAANYQVELTQRYPKEVEEHLVDVTVEGVTSKVFVPSDDQLYGENGGFSYFNSNENRKCNYNGQSVIYWTSSPSVSDCIWLVGNSGRYNGYDGGPSYTYGFRPFICFRP